MDGVDQTDYEREVSARKIASRLNEFWKVNVAVAWSNGVLKSEMTYGVPNKAFTSPTYTHPAIVRARRHGRNWYIVE